MAAGCVRSGLLWWALATRALAADATLWLEDGVDPQRAIQAAGRLGHTDPEVRDLDELVDAVQVIGVVDRRIEDLCGGPVDLDDWRRRLDEARASLQLLDLPAGLAAFSRLEAELPCLTRRLTPGDLFRFHLSTAELHLVVADSRAGDPDAQRFHREEARVAARRALTAGPGLPVPADTLRAAAELLDQVRAEQRGLARARVVVVGDARQVYDNGNPAVVDPPVGAAGGGGHDLDVPPGTHIFQLSDPGEVTVVAVQLAELAPGSAAVVWARPDAVPLNREELRAAVRTLATTGRAPVGLGPGLRALSAEGPAYVVTQDGPRLRLWGADGQQVRLRLADPPIGPSGADTARVSRLGRQGVSGDVAMHLGVLCGVLHAPPADVGGGVEVGGRVGLLVPLVATLSLDVAALGLPGLTSAWAGQGRVGAHGGLRLRPRSRLVDLGVEGGVMAPVGHGVPDDERGLRGTARGVASVRLPAESLAGLRLWAAGGWVAPASWQLSGGVAVELLADP